MFALVDGNNFYASVERVWQPELRGKPVIVLSNNDGCAIARSQEAKALGIKMGQPLHQIPPEVRRQLHVRSANFALYGDMSARVVAVLRDLFPAVEVYSIDESFCDLAGVGDRLALAAHARSRILQWVGVPCCVGIGVTKTLAKAANKLAKSTVDGVVEIVDPLEQLREFPVDDVWGVGPRFAARLGAEGILTAADLIRADAETLRARYGVVLARTQLELRGTPCMELEEAEADRQQIVVSRSFGSEVTAREDLAQSVATFAARACEKLRARSLQAGGLWVWLNTNPFREGAAQYHPSRSIAFPVSTTDTRQLLGVAGADVRVTPLMEVLDQANRRFGRGAVGFASATSRRGPAPAWGMKQSSLSQAFTTRWDQLLRVK